MLLYLNHFMAEIDLLYEIPKKERFLPEVVKVPKMKDLTDIDI
jgi:hypothetical protein